MSQSNKGVVAVVVGGCLLGLALGLGYILYWAPREKAKEARSEIREWSQRWQKTRACILGAQPASGNALEAMIARELSVPDMGREVGQCMGLLKALPRKDGASTDEQDVEDAWYALRLPLGKLAQAHAWRTAKEPDTDPLTLWTNLAAAISAVDAQHDALLTSAGLRLPAKSSEMLNAATPVQKLHTPGPTAANISEVALQPNVITYMVQGEDGTHLAKLANDGTTSFARLSPLALRAADGDWGLWIEEDGIPVYEQQALVGAAVMAGPLDTFGEPAGDGTRLHTIANGEHISLKFAVGEQSRIALFRRAVSKSGVTTWDHQLWASKDAGQTWSPMPLPEGDIFVSLKRSSTGNFISWADSPTSMSLHYQQLTNDGPTLQTLKFDGTRAEVQNWPPELCQAPGRSWWLLDGNVYTAGGDQVLTRIPGTLEQDTKNYAQMMSCSSDGFAITSRSFDDRFKDLLAAQSCDLQACNTTPVRMPAPADAKFYPLYHQGRLTIIVAMGGFAALWTEGQSTPHVFSLGSDAEVTGAVSRQDSVQVVLWPKEAASPELLKLR